MYDLEYPKNTDGSPQTVAFLWKTIERLNYILGILQEGKPVSNTEKTKSFTLPFGKLDSSSTSTTLVAQVQGITELKDGTCAIVVNNTVSSATGFTLNINGLGAKPVYLTSGTRATTEFNSALTAMFIYNSSRVSGGCWDMYL